ncbi:hypothetical protein GCM10022402_08260 [Salinactinospora qingdaonensis]|uniref:Ribosomal protein mS38 C-terminal domain-containing protein n=1 Tax=Salinactinospora qingdaonensis TaxID=702744 RepID=A0ABP7F7L2_9ACTN
MRRCISVACRHVLPSGMVSLASRCDAGVPSCFVRSSARGGPMGSVVKKRRKRMAKKKHRKLLKRTRVQRRNKK